jgi:hypothetical protein
LLQYKLGLLLFKHVLLFVIYVFQSYLMPFYSVVYKTILVIRPAVGKKLEIKHIYVDRSSFSV